MLKVLFLDSWSHIYSSKWSCSQCDFYVKPLSATRGSSSWNEEIPPDQKLYLAIYPHFGHFFISRNWPHWPWWPTYLSNLINKMQTELQTDSLNMSGHFPLAGNAVFWHHIKIIFGYWFKFFSDTFWSCQHVKLPPAAFISLSFVVSLVRSY